MRFASAWRLALWAFSIGGNGDSNFLYLSLRGEYGSAEMTVTVAPER